MTREDSTTDTIIRLIGYIVFNFCVYHYFGGWGIATFVSLVTWIPDRWLDRE